MNRTKTTAQPEQANPDTGLTPSQVSALKAALVEHRDKHLARYKDHVETAVKEDGGADEMDCASRDQEQGYLLRLADKDRKLVREIDEALARIEEGTFGICEGSGEPIGFRRLEARPWAKYSIAYKEQLEMEERGHVKR